MNDSTLRTMIVDSLDAYLGAGKSAAEVARDLRVPNVGDGQTESDLRIRVRNLIGASESSISAFLDSLAGARGTASTFTRTQNVDGVTNKPLQVTYSVVGD